MSIVITDNTNIMTTTAGNTDKLVCAANNKRRGLIFSADGGDVWVKLIGPNDPPDNERKGILISSSANMPFRLTSGVIHWGQVCVINAIPDTSPVLHTTEMVET